MSSITSIPQAVQQGTVIGSALAWAAGAMSATITGLMSQADAGDPANQMTLYLAASFDAQGLTFERLSEAPWQGGQKTKDGTAFVAPGMIWSNSQPPTFVRVEIDVPKPLSVGFDLSAS